MAVASEQIIKHRLSKIDKGEWIYNQLKLLEIEKNVEIECSKLQYEEQSLSGLEAKGNVLSNLVASEKSTGLFGRPTLKLLSRPVPGKSPDLPSHTFSSGDIIGIYEHGKGSSGDHVASAVVIRTSTTHLNIALDSQTSEFVDIKDDAVYRIRKLANDVTYRRIKKSLQRLGSCESGQSEHLIGVLFGELPPYAPLPLVPSSLCKTGNLQLFNEKLDASQISAVEFSLRQKDLAVIHGPPGTGKTTTLIEVILQHVKLGNKVLAVAPSNLAVDNMLERLVLAGTKVVRLGHPARATPKAQLRSLDALLQASDEYSLLKDVRADVTDTVTKLGRTRDQRHRAKLREEIKRFRKELKEREIRLAKQILKDCDVTLATLTSSGDDGTLKHLEEDFFGLTVIDECSQGLEASCYMSVLKSPKLLLAGDHLQLPPTVFSTEAASRELLVSLMERVVGMYGDSVTQMLKMQYRMNSNIMAWASKALYNNELCAHDSVSSHLLHQLSGVDSNDDTENSLVLIDTCGCHFEEVAGEELSKGNEGEAVVVTSYVKSLLQAGVSPVDVAVITPYNLQVEFIRNRLHKDFPAVEVRSVDGFQGREKEAVVISLVRSNNEGGIGFLAEDRRLNVAVTRARRHLAVVCDSDTVCRHQFIKGLIDHITDNGDVRSAMEYITDDFIPSFQPVKSKATDGKNAKQEQSRQVRSTEEIETANAKRREKFTEKISKFHSSNNLTLAFEPGLNSFERRLVHEISQEFGLLHGSSGDGKERQIVVRKPILHGEYTEGDIEVNQTMTSVPVTTDGIPLCDTKEYIPLPSVVGSDVIPESARVDDLNLMQNRVKSKIGAVKTTNMEAKRIEKNKKPKKLKENKRNNSHPDTKMCTLCKKDILSGNLQLHSLQCERIQKDNILKAEISKQKERNLSIAKNAASGTKTKEEYFNAVVGAFEKDNKTCSFPRCKNQFVPLLQVCVFCRTTFCLAHHQAEVHGCGQSARNHARRNIPKQIKNGSIVPGSGIPCQKSSESNRAHLRTQLDKKIEKAAIRRRKTKKSDKS